MFNLIANAESVCRVNGQVVPCPAGLGVIASIVPILVIVVFVIMIASMWRIFTKAGKPGWASIVPIYNIIVMIDIVKMPVWTIILVFIPFVNAVFMLVVIYNLGKVFGKEMGFILGMIFLSPIFYPILAWSDAAYQGGSSSTNDIPQAPQF